MRALEPFVTLLLLHFRKRSLCSFRCEKDTLQKNREKFQNAAFGKNPQSRNFAACRGVAKKDGDAPRIASS